MKFVLLALFLPLTYSGSDVTTSTSNSSDQSEDTSSNLSFVPSSVFDCTKVKLEIENVNPDQVYSLQPSATSLDNFGTAFYKIEENQTVKLQVKVKNEGPKFEFCAAETPFAKDTSGIDFFVEDDT